MEQQAFIPIGQRSPPEVGEVGRVRRTWTFASLPAAQLREGGHASCGLHE
jgi:hypothetical protein